MVSCAKKSSKNLTADEAVKSVLVLAAEDDAGAVGFSAANEAAGGSSVSASAAAMAALVHLTDAAFHMFFPNLYFPFLLSNGRAPIL